MSILSVELVIFIVIMYTLYTLRKYYQDLFFLPKDVDVFLPPAENDVQALKEYNKQQQKKKIKTKLKKPFLAIKMFKASNQYLEKVRFMDDLEAITLFTTATIILIIIIEAIRFIHIIPNQYSSPNFIFYMLSFLIIYSTFTMAKIASIGGMTIYENRISIAISILSSFLMTALLFGAPQLIDINWNKIILKTLYHLRSIANSLEAEFDYINRDNIFKLTLVLLIPFVYSLVPIILKFGNCYVNIMKEIYKEESIMKDNKEEEKGQEQENATSTDKTSSPETAAAVANDSHNQEILQSIKQSKRTITWFNGTLILNMIIIVFWIKPVTASLKYYIATLNLPISPDPIIELLKYFFILLHLISNSITYKPEIKRYMAKAYDSISTLLKDSSEENLKLVQHKTRAHIQIMGAVSFQVALKIFLPLLLCLMCIIKSPLMQHYHQQVQHKQYYHPQVYTNNSSINNTNITLANSAFNHDWNCMIITDPKEIFSQFSNKCPKSRQMQIIKLDHGYGITTENHYNFHNDLFASGRDVIRKINTYGLIPDDFWYTLFSFWSFIYYIVFYFLSIIYLIYKHKTEQS